MNLAHLQLLDSALPIGTFAHSFGLEAAVDEGAVASADDLASAIAGLLGGRWAPVDARLVAAAHDALADGSDEAFAELWHAAAVVHVATPSSRSRAAAASTGRRLLKLLPDLYPDVDVARLASAVDGDLAPPLHALVHGWATWHLGVSRDEAAHGWLYAAVTGCVASAVRLMALGQTDAQRTIARSLELVPDAWSAANHRPLAELAGFAPLAEEWAMRQPRLEGRLFMS